MPKPRAVLAISLSLLLAAGLASHFLGDDAPNTAPNLKHSYTQALTQARNGLPGAARVLYQQLARTDLSAIRRASLLAELPNYPSPQALKLASADLQHDDALVRRAAITSINALVPPAQRSLLLGPLLDDQDPRVRFAAVDALRTLTADEVGLYFGPLQQAIADYKALLQDQPDDVAAQVHLAELLTRDDDFTPASQALERALALEPDNLDALAGKVRLLDRQGHADRSREVLAQALLRHPESAFLQHELGQWLIRHDQQEYALLALARCVELEPENTDYRYELAISLHTLEQTDAAQKQLEAILARQPANRRARVLLIDYWNKSGQLQNVQILLAQLEQQNPDDPLVQQGL